MSDKRCNHYDCVYYSPSTNTCDYMIIAGTPRGCKATEDCEKYCTDVSQVKPLYLAYKMRDINFKHIRRMEKFYVEGDSPETLAKRSGIPESQTYLWMRKVHPEAMNPMGVPTW